MQPIELFYPQLDTPRKVVITMHQKPDGDAMGSALGLYHFLVELGHDATVISPTNWAEFLNWMPGVKKVIVEQTWEPGWSSNRLTDEGRRKLGLAG